MPAAQGNLRRHTSAEIPLRALAGRHGAPGSARRLRFSRRAPLPGAPIPIAPPRNEPRLPGMRWLHPEYRPAHTSGPGHAFGPFTQGVNLCASTGNHQLRMIWGCVAQDQPSPIHPGDYSCFREFADFRANHPATAGACSSQAIKSSASKARTLAHGFPDDDYSSKSFCL